VSKKKQKKVVSVRELVAGRAGVFYWAYGSNLSIKKMKERCPSAIKCARLSIPNAELVFRGVADCSYREDPNSVLHGGLWYISLADERRLDAIEGVSGKFYLKRYLRLRIEGKEERAMYYTMAMTTGVFPPGDAYLKTIAQGYRDFNLPMEALDKALRDSWEKKEPTELLIARHKRRGMKMARPSLLAN
jgi:hypothetical protein